VRRWQAFTPECVIATAQFALCCRKKKSEENAMEMSVGQLDHYNVSTRKLQETIDWYENVLGLNDIAQTDRQQRPDSGVIDHVAFGSRGFEAMKKHLTGKGVTFRINQVPSSTRWQLFFHDPNNVEIELNFETKNELAA
jgi:4-hydroxyphenylpyruvate dioxygenase-like putative hemolysin